MTIGVKELKELSGRIYSADAAGKTPADDSSSAKMRWESPSKGGRRMVERRGRGEQVEGLLGVVVLCLPIAAYSTVPSVVTLGEEPRSRHAELRKHSMSKERPREFHQKQKSRGG